VVGAEGYAELVSPILSEFDRPPVLVGHSFGGTVALAAALAGAAGLLLANQFFVTPSDGGVLILKTYIAVTIGGWGSLRGAVAGALLIAAFEVAVASQFSQPLAEGLLYVTLFIVLFFRPQGLFGEKIIERV